MPSTRMIAVIAALALSAGVLAKTESAPTQEQMLEAFDGGDFEHAREIAEEIIRANPGDWRTRYNLALILARLGDEDASAEALIDAISFGFVDLHEMERDPNLARVRQTVKYRRIVERWGVLLDAVADSRFGATAATLGPAYVDAKDDSLRLYWLSAVNGETFDQARDEARRVSAWCAAEGLFSEAEARKPDAWVTVILPTGEDFAVLVPFAMVGGTYARDEKRLVTRDLGPTLRHEFFHVLHWRDMDRMGQVHPIWVQEGMASLLEDVDDNGSGGYEIRASWRTNIAKRLERSGALRPLDVFMATERDRFVSVRPSANYAHARALMMYVHERGALGAFYRALVAGYDKDASGVVALEIALGKPITEIDREFRKWLSGLPEVGERAHPPDAGLGVAVIAGQGQAPTVAGGLDLGSKARLRGGDVITAIEGRAIATLDDLYRVLGDFEAGDEVGVSVMRGGRRAEERVVLRAREHGDGF